MKTYLTFGIVVFTMAALAFGVVKFFLAPKPSGDGTHQVEQHQKESESHGSKESDHGGGHGEGHGEGYASDVFMVEDLLVNPTATSGTRYLSASLGIEVDDPGLIGALQERELQVRDLLISILSSRTVDELTTASDRELMRSEIKQRLNHLLATKDIAAIYFVDYVLQ